MKKWIVFSLAMVFCTVVIGQQKNKNLTFEVEGNCEMCKMRIEKAALAVKGVKFAEWSIPTQQLVMVVNEKKTNAMAVKMALAEAGHDSKELKATEEAYSKIHACCQYRENDDTPDEKHE